VQNFLTFLRLSGPRYSRQNWEQIPGGSKGNQIGRPSSKHEGTVAPEKFGKFWLFGPTFGQARPPTMTPRLELSFAFETRALGLPTGRKGPAYLVSFFRYESAKFSVSEKHNFLGKNGKSPKTPTSPESLLLNGSR